MQLFIKNKLIIVVKKCYVLIGLGLAYKIPPTGLGKKP